MIYYIFIYYHLMALLHFIFYHDFLPFITFFITPFITICTLGAFIITLMIHLVYLLQKVFLHF